MCGGKVCGGKSASLRTADTPKICGNIGLVLVDGHIICTFAVSGSSETKAVSVWNMSSAAQAAAPVPRPNVCIRRHQQAADFKVACHGRAMQWRFFTEDKSKKSTKLQNKMTRAGVITGIPTPSQHPRCSAAAGGRFQGGHSTQQSDAVAFCH